MKRWLLNIFVGLSLLLFIAAVAMWVRSFVKIDQLVWNRRTEPGPYSQSFQAFSIRGQLWVNFTRRSALKPSLIAREPSQTQIAFHSDREAIHIEFLLPSWKQGNGGRQFVNFWGLSYSFGEWSGTQRSRPFLATSGLDHLLAQSRSSMHLWSFPYWLLTVLMALPPVFWVVSWRKRRTRLHAGLCHNCGYDLRATPERCPECGKGSVGKSN